MIVYRSVKGSKLTSDEVDGNFQYLEGLIGGDGNVLVTQSGFSLVDQDLTIASDWVWKILGVTYTNPSSVVINIPFAATGKTRIDLVVANQSNTFVRVAGVESDSNPVAPALPSNTILVTFYEVTDGVIDTPTTPITGTQFKQKNEAQKITQVLGGTDAVIELRTLGQQHYSVIGPVTSIAGFSKDLIVASPTAEVPYAGKDFYFENKTDHDVTLKDAFSPVDIPFNLAADLVVPTNGIVWLKYNPNTEQMDLFFKSWSEGGTSSVIKTIKTISITDLNYPDKDGFLGYLNALSPNLTILENELVEYHVTESGQIFSIDINDVVIGSGQTAILSSEVTIIKDIDFDSVFPVKMLYQATGSAFQATGGFALESVGTQSQVLHGGGGASWFKIVSAASAGTSISCRDSSFVRIKQNSGYYFEERIYINDASTISGVRGSLGLRTTTIFGNTDISTTTPVLFSMACDGADTNFQIMHQNTTSGGVTKIDLGASFPKGTGEYLIKFLRFRNSSKSFYKIIRIDSAAEAKGNVVNNPTGLTISNHRNNNASAISCGFEIQRAILRLSDDV
jgi:hypothetical protein